MPDVADQTLYQKQLRKQLLDAPVDFLPIAAPGKEKLLAMGFATVRESFRAALAGRLSYRKNAAGKLFEDEVLTACCRLLGYQPAAMQALGSYRPKRQETVRDTMAVLNGGPFVPARSLPSVSVRELFLPSVIHEALVDLEIDTVGELLAASLPRIKKTGGFGPKTLGNFLALVFDFLFIVHEPQSGVPPVPQPESDDPRPGQPGLNTRLLLTPWFSEKTLHEGAELLAAGKLRHPLFVRENAGVLIDDGRSGKVLLRFAHAPRLSQSFKVAEAACDLCGPGRGQPPFCAHAAALALHFLQVRPGLVEPGRLPLPLTFPDSPWLAIGQILFDLYGPGNQGDITVKAEEGGWRLNMTSKAVQSWFSWLLKEDTLREGAALFRDRFNLPRSFSLERDLGRRLTSLYRRLTAGEAREPEPGAFAERSLLEERDESIWFWLIRNLYTAIPPEHLQIGRPKGEKLFALTARDPESGREILNFILPRAKTPDVVDGLAKCGAGPVVTQARAFSWAEFDEEEAALVIVPCLEMADGRILPRTQLEENRYGRYYYLDGEGFVSVCEQHPDQGFGGDFREITRIGANAVPEFVERHRRALLNRDNVVEAEFRDFGIKEVPDRLKLSRCRMDDDWCYLAGFYGVGTEEVSLADLLRARERGLDHLPGHGKWLRLKDSPLEWFYNLGKERLWRDAESGREGVRLSRRELLMLSVLTPELELAIAREQEQAAIRRLLDVNNWTDQHQLPVVPAHLRDYQRNGLAWLYALYRNRLGGILADDMGLGKTHQALGLIRAIQDQGGGKRFLVVCPATVVAHWLEKIRQFYPELEPHVYHGSNRGLEQAGARNLYLTTYGIIRRDADKLAELDFEVVIFDEIQHIKNKKTDVHAAASLLKGRVVIGLTGTPLENSVHDLKAIFDICLPGFLGPDSVFKKEYADAIEIGNDRHKRDLLARLLSPFLLRRTRTQVLTELPRVIEDVRTCRLSEHQVKLYRDVIASRGRPLLTRLAEGPERNLPYLEVLAVISYLKQICNHPCLVQGETDWRLYESGKWDLFVDLLDQCLASSMKVVVFSHYTRMLDLIEGYLTEASIPFCGLRGSMPLKKREQSIHRFNTDDSCRVFCASLLAGGVGVDLTAAQAVIHYDRWWNAAREDQATARVHRMGQKHVVQTFKLVTAGTLEEKINLMIARKRELSSHLVREDDAAIIKRLSREELIELLEWSQSPEDALAGGEENGLLPTGTGPDR
ncbi:MAG: SNF2-related protein [Desulfobacteraceae bacterium]|nr:SNF2-related protein [Desulfobacteraceae bacterium]